MLRDQNPGLLLRFDPKFAVEFADFTDLELLTSAVGEGKVAMPRWVKLHALKQLGQRRAVANFGNVRAVQTLMAKVRTSQKHAIARRHGWNGGLHIV